MSKHTPVHGIAKGPDAVATQRAFRQLDVAIGSIEAAISTLEEQVENIQGGVGAVNSVTAGSNMVSVSPTTGDVIVNVVPANFAGIPQSAITNLEADLAGKSNVGHTHVQSDITDFAHTHPISEVTGLQDELDGKSDVGHLHVIADVNGLQTALDSKLPLANVSGTTNKVAKFIGTNSVGNSNIEDNGTTVAISNANLTVSGNVTFGGSASASHVANGVLNTQQVREKTQEVAFSSGTTVTLNDDTGVLVLTHPSDATLRGITGGADGRRVRVFNNSLAALYLSIEDGLATDVNRIRAGTASVPRIILNGYEFVDLYWSAQRQRWICEGPRTYMPLLVVERDVILNSVAGSTSIRGNTSIGNALTDAHTANGTLDITGPSNDDVLTVTTTGTGVTTAGKALVHASRTGTFLTGIDGTSKAYGVLAEVSMSEEGSGTTRNIAGRFVAEDGDENIALELLGDVEFDYRLGGSRIYSQGGLAVDTGGTNLNLATDSASIVNINTGLGVTNVAGALNVSGNVTLGDSSGDAHALKGTLNVNGTVGTNGQVLQIVSGVPQWGTLSSGSVSGLAAIATSGSASDLITGTVPAARMPALTGDVTSTVGTVATTIANNAVSNAKLRDSAALSVIGRSANSAGDPADIVAGADGHVLRRSGTTLGFGTIPQSSVTNLEADLSAKLPSANVSGTAGKLAKFTDTDKLGDSVISDNGFDVEIDGDTTIDGTLSVHEDVVVGSVSVDTDLPQPQVVVEGAVIASEYYFTGPVAGRMKIGHRVFTSSGTYTPTAGTKAVRLRMVGGGGGGGGAQGSPAAGSGGGSGTYYEKWISTGTIVGNYDVTIGSGGAGGSGAGGGHGSPGGATSVVINGTTYRTPGGLNGWGAGIAGWMRPGGTCSSSTLGSPDIIAGGNGGNAVAVGGQAVAGYGGSNPLGFGGEASDTHTSGPRSGRVGSGYGAGGGGAVSNSTAGFAGGAGTQGVVIIEEYA